MKYFARIVEGVVREIFTDPMTVDGVDYPLNICFHPLIIAALVECPDWVVQMATYDGTTFTNPPVVEP